MSGTAYVILGSHRSGTSAMARVLNLAGFGELPNDVLPPHPVDNPTGSWESRPVVAFDEDVMARAGGAWDRPPATVAGTPEQIVHAADLLAHQFPGSGPFILKDPRISFLVPLWHAALTGRGFRPVYVVMMRRPPEVALSLAARDAIDPSRGVALWATYTVSAERATRGHARLFVAFDDLLRSWRDVLVRVGEAAGCPAPSLDEAAEERVGRFLNPGLKRRSVGKSEPADPAPGAEEQIYGLLLATGCRTLEEQRHLDDLSGPIAGGPTPSGPEIASTPAPWPRWLLVTGAPRSGTSLLRAMLTEHPQVGLLQEYGLTDLLRRIDAIVDRPQPASEDWDSPGDPDDEAFNAAAAVYRDRAGRAAVTRGGGDPKSEHFRSVAVGLYAGMFPGKDLRYVGDKMPITAEWEDMPLLFSRLPGLRVIAVIRNPADVVRSSLVRREATRRGRDAWPIETVQEAAAQWVAAWTTLIALKDRYGPAVSVVKYEDLCSEPQAVLGRLLDWLDLPPHEVTIPISVFPAGLALHTAAEQEMLEHLMSPVIEAWPGESADALMARFASLRLPYVLGDTVRLREETATSYLDSGFSFREEWGRWTDGPRAVLSIPHRQTTGSLFVEIMIAKTFQPESGFADIVVRSGWSEPKLFSLSQGTSRVALVVQAEEAEELGTLTIELLIMRPKTPDESPPDCRALGLLVESFRVTQVPGATRPPMRS